MTAQMIPFVFRDDRVRVIMHGGEPWFVARDVCRILGIAKPENTYDRIPDDERDTCLTGDTTGREQETVILSEPGLYRMVFRSDKPQAEAFRHWVLHEVLPAIRKTGRYAPEQAQAADPFSNSELRSRIDVIREARLLFGHERARRMWAGLGLPEVPRAPEYADAAAEDAAACLETLLGHTPPGASDPLRTLLSDALDGDKAAAEICVKMGLKPLTDKGSGFLVANRHPALEAIFKGTAFQEGGWKFVLRHVPGAKGGNKARYGEVEARGTFMPMEVLDPYLDASAA